ncbi:BRI1 kinase inhibitor 1-like [Rutidosis leptorrhynchoides]|uniref:BRI1 kinase inhibitor 1-like n=1 Tax=Rutidosis leptorrhynchoides TaxID=125765 RepID=UPI003A99F98A
MEFVNIRDKLQHEQQTYMKQQELAAHQETIQSTSSPPTTTASPPSPSASPTHEFSFTISLNPQKTTQNGHNYSTYCNNDTYNDDKHHTTTSTPSSGPLTAIDLSPADDIFFHGHLLPLHLLPHLPTSPRSSTNSVDSFTLPMKDILKDQHNPIGNTSFHYHQRNTFSDFNLPNKIANHTRPKSKSFSIFSRPKCKKGSFHDDKEPNQEDKDTNTDINNNNNDNSKKKQLKLEVSKLIKRYMKMVRPLLSFQKTKRSNTEFNRQQPHSYSGNLLSSSSSLPVRRVEISAPVSMRTSPANSGVLRASGTVSPAKSTTSDSTMEELHAAIQAAIAHCKNSISMEDKINTSKE